MSVVTQIDTGGPRPLHHATLFTTSVGITSRDHRWQLLVPLPLRGMVKPAPGRFASAPEKASKLWMTGWRFSWRDGGRRGEGLGVGEILVPEQVEVLRRGCCGRVAAQVPPAYKGPA